MDALTRFVSLRSASLVTGALSVVLPFTWVVYQQWLFGRGGPHETPACGLPLIAALVIGVLLAGAMSGVAFSLGGVAYARLPKPRPRARAGELLLLALPFGAIGALFTLLWLSFTLR